jgi:hypothetical protein
MSSHPLFSPEALGFGRIWYESLRISLDLDQADIQAPTQEALRHLVGATPDRPAPANWEDFVAAAREHDAKILQADPSGCQRLLFHACLSAQVHEARHAHDVLGTVYGHGWMMDLLDCYLDTPRVLHALAAWQTESGRDLPLPLLKEGVELANLADGVLDCVRSYSQTQDLLQHWQGASFRRRSGLTIVQLLEASATDVQFAFLEAVFGMEALSHFSRLIEESPNARLYLRARNQSRDVLLAGGFQRTYAYAVVSYLVWCALVMLHSTDGLEGSEFADPAVLFAALLEHVRVFCDPQDPEPYAVARCVEVFCSKWNLLTPSECVMEYAELIGEQAREREALVQAVTSKASKEYWATPGQLARYFEMMQNFMGESGGLDYFTGSGYIKAFYDAKLPSVFMQVRAGGTVSSFLTRGKQVLSPLQWTGLSFMSGIMSYLATGPDGLRDSDWAETVPRRLQEGWLGCRLWFEDRFFEEPR